MYQLFAAVTEGGAPVLWTRRRVVACGLLGLVLVMVQACSPALSWRLVRLPEWPLVFNLPCRPDQHERALTLVGVDVNMRMVSCTADGHLFAVTSADLLDPQHVGPALQALAESARVNAQAKQVQRAPAQVPGMTPNAHAVQFTLQGQRPDGQALRLRVLVFAYGARVFQASVVGPASDDSRMAALFDSLDVVR